VADANSACDFPSKPRAVLTRSPARVRLACAILSLLVLILKGKGQAEVIGRPELQICETGRWSWKIEVNVNILVCTISPLANRANYSNRRDFIIYLP